MAAVIAVAGAFAADQSLPQHPAHQLTGMAADHGPSTRSSGGGAADGSGTALIAQRAGSYQAGQKSPRGRPAAAASPAPSPRASAHAVVTSPRAASQRTAQPRATPGTSPVQLAAAVRTDIASGNYLLAAAHYLVEHGYSDAAAAGIASCVDGESGGNPESVGSGGGGLIGWTPLSSAAPNPNIITGNVAQDMMTQLSDLLYYNSTEIGQSLVNQLNGITDPVSAADFFSLNFERPAITYSDVVPSVADQIFAELTALCGGATAASGLPGCARCAPGGPDGGRRVVS